MIEFSPPQPTGKFTELARRGFCTIPLRPRSKVPFGEWSEYQKRRPTSSELANWDASDFNVGIVCGAISGCVVLDVDDEQAQALVDSWNLPPTPVSKTSRGGHYFFQFPIDAMKNRAGLAGLKLDFRGDGGYVVGPGSTQESGHLYQWLVSPDNVPLAPLPVQLLELMNIPSRRKPQGPRPAYEPHPTATEGGPVRRLIDERLAEAIAELSAATAGVRNDTLFRVSVALARDVAGAGMDWSAFASDLGSASETVGLEAAEIDATLMSAWKRGSSEPTLWMQTAQDWIYVTRSNMFYHPVSRESIDPRAFNTAFASQHSGKGTLAGFLTQNRLVTIVHDLDYRPGEPSTLIQRDGLPWFNTFRPSLVGSAEGDPTPFTEFLEYLVPVVEERQHLMQMMAWMVRRPGEKIRHALLIRSRHQGVGKSMLIDIWSELLGRHNVRKTSTEEISGSYQGFIKQNLMVLVEELGWGVGPAGYNRLKDLITSDSAVVNEKFQPTKIWPNTATFVILTNLPTPLRVEDKDRRIFYIDTPAEPRSREYFTSFVEWWAGNLNIIRGYLETIDISDFDPSAPPPMTAAKCDLIAESRGELVKELEFAIQNRRGVFDRDVVTIDEVKDELGDVARGKSLRAISAALLAVGGANLRQHRVSGSWKRLAGGNRFVPGAGKASLWAVRNSWWWAALGPQARAEEWARETGILERLGIVICLEDYNPEEHCE